MGGYGEGPEFDELVFEGCHVLFYPGNVFLSCSEESVCTDVVSVCQWRVLLELSCEESGFRRHISELRCDNTVA